MLASMKMFVAQVARGSARPDRTLLAIAFLLSAPIVIVFQLVFGT
jgi:hypothetical protein